MLSIKGSISKKILYGFVAVALIGFLDAVFLTAKHYSGQEVSCSLTGGCNDVLTSQYATMLGFPTSLWGAGYYLVILAAALLYLKQQNWLSEKILSYFTFGGFLFSLYLVYLQLFVIQSICPYCLLSALTSTILFVLSLTCLLTKKTYEHL